MRLIIAVLLSLSCTAARAQAPLRIVAAETVYGDVAAQLAGPHASVTSILSDPAQDPHLFDATTGDRTATGKVQKFKLRARYWEGRERQVS